MSRMESGASSRQSKAQPNIYTVLAIVAALTLAVGVGYVWMSNLELTQVPANQGGQHDGMNPFYIMGQ